MVSINLHVNETAPSIQYLNHIADLVEDSIADSHQLTLNRKDTAQALMLAATRLAVELNIRPEEMDPELIKEALEATHSDYLKKYQKKMKITNTKESGYVVACSDWAAMSAYLYETKEAAIEAEKQEWDCHGWKLYKVFREVTLEEQ